MFHKISYFLQVKVIPLQKNIKNILYPEIFKSKRHEKFKKIKINSGNRNVNCGACHKYRLI